MTLEVGRIYIIPVTYIRPPKPKICLCVCEARPWFLFINTKPHRDVGHSVPISTAESSTLQYDSHLDLSAVFTYQPDDIAAGQARDLLAVPAIERAITALAAGVKQLPKVHADHVIAKLTATLPPF